MERQKRERKLSEHHKVQEVLQKINFEHFIFNFENIKEKCFKAGIRQEKQHKFYTLSQFLWAIVFAVAMTYAVMYLLEEDNISYAILSFLAGGILGFFFPSIRLDSMAKDRQKEFSYHFPDVLDLLYICVEAGMTIDRAFLRITEEYKDVSKIIHDEFSLLSAELTYFNDIVVAYNNFKQRMPLQNINTFCTSIIQAVKFGSPLSKALKVISKEERANQSAQIERKAAALPTKLTVPMMIFSLPVLFVILLYPPISSAVDKF